MVNNAGIVRDRMFVSSTVGGGVGFAVVRVHLRRATTAVARATPVRTGASSSKDGHPVDARIVNTSSGAGLQGSVGQSAYSAAKAAIAALTLVQAAELGRYGITSNAIAPSPPARA